ncbi:MAG: RsmB/NOP family class I SAM-dependent RNA methyltransferase [Clostridiales bacterium]|nr:RsmB/NOP family class I SAM-dependent RNA methyltransferase [Clostridiales bacterium]
MNSVRERLPEDFICRMRNQLEEEAEDFFSCYDKTPYAGIRINTGKLSSKEAAKRLPFVRERIPWTNNGFYVDENAAVSRHPYYYAGLYYIQEPSAMLPAARLPIEPGDRVLDLCAAPGGKTTELASRLNGTGLLVANDASASRAKALVKNLSVWGAANICITAEQPQRLLETFGCFFDKILVDAPCSGEGMFRKDPMLISSWKEKGPENYAPLQKDILSCAVQMLRPGGMLLYSTCTFSEEEDEAVIADALERFPQLELLLPDRPSGCSEGISSGASALHLERCVRIYPHRVKGEGHFLALMKKKLDDSPAPSPEKEFYPETGCREPYRRDADIPAAAAGFFSRISGTIKDAGTLESAGGRWQTICNQYHYKEIGEQCLLVPPYRLPSGIRYLRTGLLLGTWKRGRFEPSQALAMALDASSFDTVLDLPCEDERLMRYLKGETLELKEEESAALKRTLSSGDKTVLICVDGRGLGWGKLADGSIRNRFYPGWRMQ